MFILLSFLLLWPHPGDVPASRAGDVAPAADYEAALTALLQKVVTNAGLVRYDLLQGALNTDFRRVLKTIEEFDAGNLRSEAAKKAFWMNAYNVQMLQNIVGAPGVAHILDDGQAEVFFKTPFRTAGLGLSLDQIEHVILRRQDGPAAARRLRVDRLDPRIHVGLNCAALSCPRLRRHAFTAENVEAELDSAMRDFTASPVHFREEKGRFVVSSLLDWFGPDFDSAGLPAGDFLLRYMPQDRPDFAALKQLLAGRTATQLKARKEVTFAYHWAVNRAAR